MMMNDHQLIHMALSPLRLLCNGVSDTFCQAHFYNEDGMPFYAHYGLLLLNWLASNSNNNFWMIMAKCIAWAVVLVLTGACQLVEMTLGGAAVAPLVLFGTATVYLARGARK